MTPPVPGLCDHWRHFDDADRTEGTIDNVNETGITGVPDVAFRFAGT